MSFVVTITTDRLEVGYQVRLKGEFWTVTAINGPDVTVSLNGISRTGRKETWLVRKPETAGVDAVPPAVGSEATRELNGNFPPVTNPEYLMTTQEYLRAIGMPDDDLEGSAKTFGTVVMRFYRERHGKTAKPAKKLEYVHYLDVNGLEAQRPNSDAPPHLRVRQNGWYESNAFTAEDLDLLDRVREARHPSLPTLDDAFRAAIDTLVEAGVYGEHQRGMLHSVGTRPEEIRQARWLVEEAVSACLASGVVCGHTECARRRAKRSNRVNAYQLEEMDWS